MRALPPISQAEAAALCYIAGYLEAHRGISPTVGQIRRALGLSSKSAAWRLLVRLEARGMLRRLRYRHQAIELIQPIAIPRAPDGAPLHFVPAGRERAATAERNAS
jgi:SOS-response transcriptional repressor LexA